MASPISKGGRNSTGTGTNGNISEKGGGSIDRESKCPLLLRVFCATSRHNSLSDYNKGTANDKFCHDMLQYCRNCGGSGLGVS